MKKTIFVFFTFLIICNVFSQTGWVVYNTGTNKPIRDIYFVDANTGWAVGDSVIVKSTNGGVNWTQQSFSYPGGALLLCLKFINPNTGFAGGGNFTSEYTFAQYIFKTINGGINWTKIYESSYFGAINNILPINESVIYITLSGAIEAVHSVGGIYKSTNGGQTFSLCISKGRHTSLYFINEFTGWTTSAMTSDMVNITTSKILKTNDGGNSWVTQFRDSGIYCSKINKVQFINEFTGYAIGYKSNDKTVFYKTTNSGTYWDTITYNNHNKNYSLFFLNQNIGWISGSFYPDSTSIAYTTNGGLNWQKQFKNYTYSVSQLNFINNLTGWATLGYNSSNILRTTTGGITFINNISSEIPDKFFLYQNYPNPFNPSTNISYKVKSYKVIKLSVYDVVGKEIAKLVNEKQSPGTYEVKFEAEDLPSGVYFYKLVSENYSETRKMVLIK